MASGYDSGPEYTTSDPRDTYSTSHVLGMHEQLNPGAVPASDSPLTEFEHKCADLIDKVLGGNAALKGLGALLKVDDWNAQRPVGNRTVTSVPQADTPVTSPTLPAGTF